MGGSSGKTNTSTSQVQIPKEILDRYNSVNARAEQAATQQFQQYSQDPNAFVAPLNQTQQAGMQNINNASGMAQPYYQAAANLTAQGTQSVNPGELNIGKYMSPYTQSVADTTFANLRQQQQQEMGGQTANAIRSGGFGGDRSGLAAANLARQQTMGTAAAMAPIYQQGYGQALGAAQQQQGVGLGAEQANQARYLAAGQQFAGLGSGAQSAALQGGQAQMGAGQVQQTTEQAGRQALYNQFLQQQGYPFQVAQFLANIAMGTGALSGSTTTTTQPAPFFSDRRLKEGEKEIGRTHDGQPIYKFRYKGDDRTQIGLMAQDVEKKHPEAVGLAAGYKTVDYDKATEASERGHYADGGFADILAHQQQMYGLGAPQGGASMSGAPGSSGYVKIDPNVSISRQLIQPTKHAPPPPSLLQEAQTGLGAAESITKGWGAAKEGYNWLTGKSDKEGSSAGTQVARGGLVGYAGGGMPYAGPDDPLSDVVKEGKQQVQMMKPGAPPPQQQSGLGQIGDIARTGASLGSAASGLGEMFAALPFFALARGGVAGRHAYADGGDTTVLDEPSDRELGIRTIAAEMSGKSYPEAVGIGAVLHNRLKSGAHGNSIGDVVLQENQFEPWTVPGGPNDPMGIDPASPRYKLAERAFDAAAGGLDPTGGARHFYAPAAQAALGRPAPSWDTGGTLIGASKFVGGKPDAAAVEGLAGSAAAPVAAPARAAPASGLIAALTPEERPAGEAWTGSTGQRFLAPGGNQPRTKGGLMDVLTSEKFLLPLMSGLGAMASSPSRYLGAAALTGLGGAANTYAKLASENTQQTAEMGLLGVNQVKTQAELAGQLRMINASREASGLPPLSMAELLSGSPASSINPYDKPNATKVVTGSPGSSGTSPPASTPGSTTSPAMPPVAKNPEMEQFLKNVDPNFHPTTIQARIAKLDEEAAVMGQYGYTDKKFELEKRANDMRKEFQDMLAGDKQVFMKDGTPRKWPGSVEAKAAALAAETRARTGAEGVVKANQEIMSQAQAAHANAVNTLSTASKMYDAMFDPVTGKPLVSTGPKGEIINHIAGIARQVGVDPDLINNFTNPEKAQEIDKFTTQLGAEMARLSMGPENGVYQKEFLRFLQAVPGLGILPETFRKMISESIKPQAEQYIKAYQHVADMDPAKDNVRKAYSTYLEKNPWYKKQDPATPSGASYKEGDVVTNSRGQRARRVGTGWELITP